jgi:hypothetical protein
MQNLGTSKSKSKKISICFFAFLIFTTIQILGQENLNFHKPGYSVSLCGADKDSAKVKYSDLLKCTELTLVYKDVNGNTLESNNKYTIKSFNIGFNIEGIYREINNVGSKLNNETLEFIKNNQSRKANAMFISDIYLINSDEKTETKNNGILLILQE